MKICPACGAQVEDNSLFCHNCGASLAGVSGASGNNGTANENAGSGAASERNNGAGAADAQGVAPGPVPYQNAREDYASYIPDWDHTDEFDLKDVHDNKVVVMIMYLSGLYGTLICFAILWLLGKSRSDYLAFHVRENFKISLVNTLLGLIAVIFCWTVIIPILCGVMFLILLVIRFICFVGAARNQSKEVALIRNFGFLR